MQNPFTLTFGKSPLEPIERPLYVYSGNGKSADVHYHRCTRFGKNSDDD